MDVLASDVTKPDCCINSLFCHPRSHRSRIFCILCHRSTFLTFLAKKKKHMEPPYKQFFPSLQSLSIVLPLAFKSMILSSSFNLFLVAILTSLHTVCTMTRSSKFLVHKPFVDVPSQRNGEKSFSHCPFYLRITLLSPQSTLLLYLDVSLQTNV